ncbi:MAG: sulfatase [Planctomycetota bacterium]
MKKLIHFTCFVLVAILGLSQISCAADRPNIIFMLIDDMGWTDLSCMGSKYYETPNVDKLAAEGMKFTQAYSACTVCSPTRASILTGQYPGRLHITDWIAGHVKPHAKLSVPDWLMHLPTDIPNLPQMLKPSGFASASIGKWHLGGEAYFPEKQGFDLNVAGTDRGQPPSYFSPYKIATLPDGPVGEFLSDRLTDEACKFIETNKARPFFLYMPHFGVHTPLMAKPDVIKKYKAKTDPNGQQHNAVYAGLVESIDDSVGRIMKKLDDLKLAENTIVIFNSDNGGLIGPTYNLGLRAGKGSAYEGGVRVPLIVKWPGVTKPGSVCTSPVISVDYLPTLLAMVGASDASKGVVDGESLVPLLNQTAALKRDAIYWHYPHYHPGGATPYGAVREGDFKLIEFFEDNHVELYNLKDDQLEKNDLAKTMPEKATALRQKLHDWRTKVGAQMPTPNPNYNPNPPEPKNKKDKKQAAAEIERVMEAS